MVRRALPGRRDDFGPAGWRIVGIRRVGRQLRRLDERTCVHCGRSAGRHGLHRLQRLSFEGCLHRSGFSESGQTAVQQRQQQLRSCGRFCVAAPLGRQGQNHSARRLSDYVHAHWARGVFGCSGRSSRLLRQRHEPGVYEHCHYPEPGSGSDTELHADTGCLS